MHIINFVGEGFYALPLVFSKCFVIFGGQAQIHSPTIVIFSFFDLFRVVHEPPLRCCASPICCRGGISKGVSPFVGSTLKGWDEPLGLGERNRARHYNFKFYILYCGCQCRTDYSGIITQCCNFYLCLSYLFTINIFLCIFNNRFEKIVALHTYSSANN